MPTVAQFQGTINLRMFWTGYSIDGTPVDSPKFIPSTGSQPLVGGIASQPYSNAPFACRYINSSSSFLGYNQVVGGSIGILTIGGYLTMSINGGSNALASYSARGNWTLPFMYQNVLTVPAPSANQNSAFGNQPIQPSYAFTPFTQNTSVGPLQFRNDFTLAVGGTVPSGASVDYIYTSSGSSFASGGRINIVISYPTGQFNFEGFTSPITRNASGPYYGVHVGFSGAYGLYQDTDIRAQYTHYMDHIIPAPEISSNFQWLSTGTPANIYVRSFTATYNLLAGTMGFNVTPYDSWSTDNATINSRISAQQYNFVPCAICWLLGTVDGDFIISKDGLKYWKLNYIPSNALPVQPTQGGNFYNLYPTGGAQKWIDKQGLLWFIGNGLSQDNGGTRTFYPAYSLQLNLTAPSGVTLPNIPPLAGPCWSPCYDRIGGIPGNISPLGRLNID